MSPGSSAERIADVLDVCEEGAAIVERGRSAFDSDALLQTLVKNIFEVKSRLEDISSHE